MAHILAIDDDKNYIESMLSYLEIRGHAARGESSPPPAADIAGKYDLVLLDIDFGALAKVDGFSALDSYVAVGLPVAMVSGQADTVNAVRAIKAGAVDVLDKPVDLDRLELVIAMAETRAALEHSERAGRDAWLAEHLYVGESGAMRQLVAAAERAAKTTLGILLHGPSGSGKEPLAKWIHLRSRRSDGPFVAINCAAIPLELAESEFFGHRRGAFTGADRDRPGCFMEADGGTLFLDEVGELPPAMQAKLLRAIESGEYRPVGADETRKVDVRLVSATNRDLKSEVATGTFREDLLYRLAQVPLAVPPLSSRRSDIPGLARFFADRLGRIHLDEGALSYLARRDWPGNVRELKSLIERVAALAPGGNIDEGILESLETMSRSGLTHHTWTGAPEKPVSPALAGYSSS